MSLCVCESPTYSGNVKHSLYNECLCVSVHVFECVKSSTYCCDVTIPIVFSFFNVLNNLQSFSSFLNAGVASTEKKNFWCCVEYKHIIVVQG